MQTIKMLSEKKEKLEHTATSYSTGTPLESKDLFPLSRGVGRSASQASILSGGCS